MKRLKLLTLWLTACLMALLIYMGQSQGTYQVLISSTYHTPPSGTPSPTPAGCTTIPGTSIQVGQSCFPRASCPAQTFAHDPIGFGTCATNPSACTNGTTEMSGNISSAIAAGVAQGGHGDLFFGTPGTYLVNLTAGGTYVNPIGIEPPNGESIECVAGVTLKQTLTGTGTPTSIVTYNNTSGGTICGCDFQGAQAAGAGPHSIIDNNMSAVQVYNAASNIEIEGNTFHQCTGNSCIQTPTGSITGPTNLDVSFNTFSLSPFYCVNLDSQVTNMNVHNNMGTDCVFGVEWDGCPNGTSAGTEHIYNNMAQVQYGSCFQTSGSACGHPGYSSTSGGSGTTCNYSGVLIGGTNNSFANYCTGLASIPALYDGNGSPATPGTMTNNIIGPNCSCSNPSGGGVC